jgi:hypothetical protein
MLRDHLAWAEANGIHTVRFDVPPIPLRCARAWCCCVHLHH